MGGVLALECVMFLLFDRDLVTDWQVAVYSRSRVAPVTQKEIETGAVPLANPATQMGRVGGQQLSENY